jgi:lipopolysaccharide/colanic/teichoic acid biosynthesis glycosyltransferase
MKTLYLFLKRTLDIILSGMALLIFSPLFIPLMIILKLTGEGHIFYTQKRVGFKNVEFNLIKFATMLKNSPNIGTGTITTKNDPRVLPMGNLLRKTKINELPQLINILKGDMSIVGPRPQTMECFNMFPADRRDKIYLSKPGLTGIGSIVFRNEEEIIGKSSKSYDACYREDIMPYKADLELWYLKEKSLWVDTVIIVLTALEVLLPDTQIYKKIFADLPLVTAVPK